MIMYALKFCLLKNSYTANGILSTNMLSTPILYRLYSTNKKNNEIALIFYTIFIYICNKKYLLHFLKSFFSTK